MNTPTMCPRSLDPYHIEAATKVPPLMVRTKMATKKKTFLKR